MQIPSMNLAASLAGASGKPSLERSPGIDANSSVTQSQVEQSNQSNPDRDAQGQGDGLNRPRTAKQPAQTHTNSASQSSDKDSANTFPNLPGEPPSQLDLLG